MSNLSTYLVSFGADISGFTKGFQEVIKDSQKVNDTTIAPQIDTSSFANFKKQLQSIFGTIEVPVQLKYDLNEQYIHKQQILQEATKAWGSKNPEVTYNSVYDDKLDEIEQLSSTAQQSGNWDAVLSKVRDIYLYAQQINTISQNANGKSVFKTEDLIDDIYDVEKYESLTKEMQVNLDNFSAACQDIDMSTGILASKQISDNIKNATAYSKQLESLGASQGSSIDYKNIKGIRGVTKIGTGNGSGDNTGTGNGTGVGTGSGSGNGTPVEVKPTVSDSDIQAIFDKIKTVASETEIPIFVMPDDNSLTSFVQKIQDKIAESGTVLVPYSVDGTKKNNKEAIAVNVKTTQTSIEDIFSQISKYSDEHSAKIQVVPASLSLSNLRDNIQKYLNKQEFRIKTINIDSKDGFKSDNAEPEETNNNDSDTKVIKGQAAVSALSQSLTDYKTLVSEITSEESGMLEQVAAQSDKLTASLKSGITALADALTKLQNLGITNITSSVSTDDTHGDAGTQALNEIKNWDFSEADLNGLKEIDKLKIRYGQLSSAINDCYRQENNLIKLQSNPEANANAIESTTNAITKGKEYIAQVRAKIDATEASTKAMKKLKITQEAQLQSKATTQGYAIDITGSKNQDLANPSINTAKELSDKYINLKTTMKEVAGYEKELSKAKTNPDGNQETITALKQNIQVGNDYINQIRSEIDANADTSESITKLKASRDAEIEALKNTLSQQSSVNDAKAIDSVGVEETNSQIKTLAKTYDELESSMKRSSKYDQQITSLSTNSSKNQEQISQLSEMKKAEDEYATSLKIEINRNTSTIASVNELKASREDGLKTLQATLNQQSGMSNAKAIDVVNTSDIKSQMNELNTVYANMKQSISRMSKYKKELSSAETDVTKNPELISSLKNNISAEEEYINNLKAEIEANNSVDESINALKASREAEIEALKKVAVQEENVSEAKAKDATTKKIASVDTTQTDTLTKLTGIQDIISQSNQVAKATTLINDAITNQKTAGATINETIQKFKNGEITFKDLSAAIDEYTESSKNMVEQSRKLKTSAYANARTGLGEAINSDSKDGSFSDSQSAKDFIKNYYNSQNKLEQISSITTTSKGYKQFTATVDGADNSLETLTYTLDTNTGVLYKSQTAAGKSANAFDKMAVTARKVVNYFIRYAAMYLSAQQLFSAIRQGVTYVETLDTALTSLQVVTGKSDKELSQFANDAQKVATSVASTTADVVNSATDWARLGYSMSDSLELAAQSAKLAKTGFMEVSEATEYMTSSIQAFYGADISEGLTTAGEAAQHVNDELVAIGNNMPITSEGLGTALEKSAGTLVAAGNSIEEAVALLSTANATIQSPETVGNSLKTVSMRLRGTSADKIAEETGEDMEGMSASASKLYATVKKLTSVSSNQFQGISILTDTGAYKSTYNIIKEIAAVWSEMSDVNQAATLEELAGKRQASSLAAIFNNPELLQKGYDVANSAIGTSDTAMTTALDSVEAKVSNLQNSWQTFWQTLIDSDSAKDILDIVNAIVTGLDKIIAGGNRIGNLSSLVAILTGGSQIINTIRSNDPSSYSGGRVKKFTLKNMPPTGLTVMCMSCA